jgi:hypothetical protein
MIIKIKGKEDFRRPLFYFNSYRNITFSKDVQLSQVVIMCQDLNVCGIVTATWQLRLPELKCTVVGYLDIT